MNPPDRSTARPEPLALDVLLTEDQRRTVSVDRHLAFREAISTRPAVDPVHELMEELRQAEFEGKGSQL